MISFLALLATISCLPVIPGEERHVIVLTGDPAATPDSVLWSTGGLHGRAQVISDHQGTRVLLPEAELIADSVLLTFWTATIRTARLTYRRGSNGKLSLAQADVHKQAVALLRILDSANAASPGSFPRSSEGLSRLLALQLLSGDPAFDGFPGSVPAGLDPARIDTLALILAATSGLPLDTLVSRWSLPHTSAEAKGMYERLQKDGRITSTMFDQLIRPAVSAPARDTTAPSITLLLPSQGATLPAGTTRLLVRVRVEDASKIEKVTIAGAVALPSDSNGWSLEIGVDEGMNSVSINALDTCGNSDSLGVSVSVAAQAIDSTDAGLLRFGENLPGVLSGKDSLWTLAVPNEVERVILSPVPSAIGATVTISSATVPNLSIALSPDGDTTQHDIVVCSPDRRKALRYTLRIEHAPPRGLSLAFDGVSPVLVPFEVRKQRVAWKISGSREMGPVRISGLDAALSASGYFEREIDLPSPGPRVVRIEAGYAGGRLRWADSVIILRGGDETPPEIKVLTRSRVVGPETDSLLIQASITENDTAVVRVTIGGQAAELADGLFQRAVDLKPGRNEIEIAATDAANLKSSAKVSVFRDIDPPSIRPLSPADTTTPWLRGGAYVIRWEVTDSHQVAWVKANGRTLTRGAIVRYDAPYSPGKNEVVLTVSDSVGNVRKDTIRFTTALIDPRDGRKYRIRQMPDGQVWMAEDLDVSPPGVDTNRKHEVGEVYGFTHAWTYTWDEMTAIAPWLNPRPVITLPWRGICPVRWHVAAESEWHRLLHAVGGSDSVGAIPLKSDSGWFSYAQNMFDPSGDYHMDYNGTDQYEDFLVPNFAWFNGDHGIIDGGQTAQYWMLTGPADKLENEWGVVFNQSVHFAPAAGALRSVRCLAD